MFPHTLNCELVTLFTREHVKKDAKKLKVATLTDEVSSSIDNALNVACNVENDKIVDSNVDTINIGNDNVQKEESKINEIDEREIGMVVNKEQMNIEEAAVKPETILNSNGQINIDEKEVKKMVDEKDA